MTNGIHSHKCKRCGEMFECALVTHCRRDYEVAECYNCTAELMKKDEENAKRNIEDKKDK